jgi:WD40 repeat protein
VLSLAFSRDGRRLASASSDGSVVVWDPASGKDVLTLTGCSQQGANATFSADGRLVAAIGRDNTTVRLWDVESGKRQEPLALIGGEVRSVAFHPGGQMVAFASEANQVGLAEIDSDRVLEMLPTQGKPLRVAFSRDGSRLAAITDAPDSAVYCWDVASRKQKVVLRGHRGVVRGLAIHPDGNLLATADQAGTVRLWQLDAEGKGATLTTIGLPGLAGVVHLAFSPDGRSLAAAGEKGLITVLRVPAPPPAYHPGPRQQPPDLAKLASQRCPVDALQPKAIPPILLENTFGAAAKAPPELVALLGDDHFLVPRGEGTLMRNDCSPDGKYLAVPRGNEVIIFETPSGKYLRSLKGPAGRMRRTVFSPNSKLLAATAWDGGKQNLVWVWDIANDWKLLERKPSLTLELDYLVFTSDSKNVITSGRVGEPLQVASARTGEKVQELGLSPGSKVMIHLAGKHLVATDWVSSKVILWDTTTWQESRSLERAAAGAGAPAISPDGKWLAAGANNEVQLFSVETGEVVHTLNTVGNHLAFTPNSKVLLAWGTLDTNVMHTVTRWDVASGKELGRFALIGPKSLFFPCLSHDGKELYLTHPETGYPYVRVFDAETGKERLLARHTGPVFAVAIGADGKLLASGGADGTVRLWDLATGALRRTLTGHQYRVLSVAFSRDGKLLASAGADRIVRLWDPTTGEQVQALTGAGGLIRDVAISPDGNTVAAAEGEGAARVWDLRSGKPLRSFHGGECDCVAFSPDSRTLVASDDHIIRLWDLQTGWCVATLPGHASLVLSAAFHPDGQRLVSTGMHEDPTVRVWDLATLEEKVRLAGHSGDVMVALWRCDGKAILSCGEVDGAARIWDMTVNPPQARVVRLQPPGMTHRHIAQTPEGRYLATANSDGTIAILKLADPGAPQGK